MDNPLEVKDGIQLDFSNSDTELPKVEEPVAEEVIDKDEPKKEELPKEEEPKKEVEVEEEEKSKPKEDDAWVKEKEELTSKLSQMEAKLTELGAGSFVDDEMRSLNEWKKNNPNESLENFFKYKQIRFDEKQPSEKKDALDLVTLELKESNPEWNEDKVQRYIKKKYKDLFDSSYSETDDEYQDALLDLEMDAKKAKNFLAEKTSKYTLPKVDLEEVQNRTKMQEKALQEFHTAVDKEVNDFNSYPIKVSDDLQVNYEVSSEHKKFINQTMKDTNSFFQQYVENVDGKPNVNFARLKQDLLKVAAFDDLLKVAIDQAKSEAKKEVIDKNLVNADTELKNQRTTEQSGSYMEQILTQLPKRR